MSRHIQARAPGRPLRSSAAVLPTHAAVRPAPAQRQLQGLVQEGLGGPGGALEPQTRELMTQRFGRDFSQVRVHTGSAAARSARALGAEAYTVGRDIVFDQGRYDPADRRSLGLLAHELTHVTQQSPLRTADAAQLPLGPAAAEGAAERNGARMERGGAGPMELASTAGEPLIQRQPKPGSKDPNQGHHVPAENLRPDAGTATISEEEAWGDTEARITPELENAFQDLVRVAAADAKFQVRDLVKSYDDSLSDPNKKFLAIMGAFLGGAGNTPNDPQREKFATASYSGALGGVMTSAMSGVLGILLDTGSVGDIKEAATLDVEEAVADKLTIDSDIYKNFENEARTSIQATFQDVWEHRSANLQTKEKSLSLAQRLRTVVRQEWGVHGDTGRNTLKTVGDALHKQLEQRLRPALDKLSKGQRSRRLWWGGGGGAIGGAVIGGAIGLAGGAGWAALGGLIGSVAGFGLGLAGGAIFNAVSKPKKDDSTWDKRREERFKKRNDPDQPKLDLDDDAYPAAAKAK
ncbi:MAG: DUF4157 domain-containing protein [Nevskia sp.]|nr:DUF4157 domain-containing protein [Nevskia sp.]